MIHLSSLHGELICKNSCKTYGTLNTHGINERFSFNDLLLLLFRYGTMRRQRGWVVSSSDSESGDSSSDHKLGVFFGRLEFKSSAMLALLRGCLLPAPVRSYLCCVLEIIWEQVKIFFHVPIFRITPQLCKPYTTYDPLIWSDQGLQLKTTVFDPFPELNCLFPTQLKEANFYVLQQIWVLHCCKSIMYSAANAINK